jgi:hypothetical protein
LFYCCFIVLLAKVIWLRLVITLGATLEPVNRWCHEERFLFKKRITFFLRIKKFDDRNCLFLTILTILAFLMCVSLNAQMNSALGTTNLATGPSEKNLSHIRNRKWEKKLLRQKCWLHMKFVSWSIFDLVVMKIGKRQQIHNVVQMLKWKFRARKFLQYISPYKKQSSDNKHSINNYQLKRHIWKNMSMWGQKEQSKSTDYFWKSLRLLKMLA